jgi:RND family efflux transporter MFP subunit
VTLYAKVSGYVKQLRADVGDDVETDDVLAVLESPELDQQYEAALADARNKRVIADRDTQLVERKLIAPEESETARAAADSAEATVHSFAAQKAYEVIRAPFAGKVTARYVDPGALVQNAAQAQTGAVPVVTVSQIDRLRVFFYVDQRDATFVHGGDAVSIRAPERPGEPIAAKVARISSELDPRTRMMLAEADVANEGRLVPGSFVEVTIEVKVPTFVEVPVSALVLRAKKPFVAVIGKDDRLALRPVVLASDDGQKARILEGLEVGERVGLNVGDTVAEGERVQPLAVTTAAR